MKTEKDIRLLRIDFERESIQMQRYHNLEEIKLLENQIQLIDWILNEELIDKEKK